MITVNFQQCFLFIFLCLCLLLFFFKKPKQHSNLPPSPPSFPIIGHLHLLLSILTHQSLKKLASKYGPLLHLRIFNLSIVLVSSPSITYEIFKTHDANVSSRGVPVADESLLLGSSTYVMAPYGDYWKYMKKIMVTKMLGPQALERSRGVRTKELERFYVNLADKARKNESVEIGKEAMKLTNNRIYTMIMGRSCSEENGDAERIRGLVTETFLLTKKCLFASMFKKFGISLFKKDILSVSSRFDELIERILQEHEENREKQEGMGMIDMLLAAYHDENAEYKLTRNHIKAFLLEMLVGGTDTSAQATQWTMAEIINNPTILEKLREEIESVVGKSRLIQETDLPNLPYLQAVVKEGLRLHPQTTVFPRVLQEGCKIGGFYVPEKTTVVINSYVMMRDPEFWEDPEEFKPERFLKGREDERDQSMKYIPFGYGRRGCPGANLAHIFIGTAIGTMVQCFDWIIEGGKKVNMHESVEGLTITMAHPLKCIPVPRIDTFQF